MVPTRCRQNGPMISTFRKIKLSQVLLCEGAEIGCVDLLGLGELLMRSLSIQIDGHLVVIKLVGD